MHTNWIRIMGSGKFFQKKVLLSFVFSSNETRSTTLWVLCIIWIMWTAKCWCQPTKKNCPYTFHKCCSDTTSILLVWPEDTENHIPLLHTWLSLLWMDARIYKQSIGDANDAKNLPLTCVLIWLLSQQTTYFV